MDGFEVRQKYLAAIEPAVDDAEEACANNENFELFLSTDSHMLSYFYCLTDRLSNFADVCDLFSRIYRSLRLGYQLNLVLFTYSYDCQSTILLQRGVKKLRQTEFTVVEFEGVPLADSLLPVFLKFVSNDRVIQSAAPVEALFCRFDWQALRLLAELKYVQAAPGNIKLYVENEKEINEKVRQYIKQGQDSTNLL